MSIPALLIFKNGQVVDQIVGAQPAPVLRQRLARQVRQRDDTWRLERPCHLNSQWIRWRVRCMTWATSGHATWLWRN